MAQPRILCQGALKFWVQKEWHRVTAVIIANRDLHSLTLTELPFNKWLSSPSQGVILDMSLSSALAMESAPIDTVDVAFLILLFTQRSTHVLSAVSEQERIMWQEKFEQIIGEEWKFKVTIPCQLDLKQECQGVLRFNTKRRTVVITCTQDSSQLPSVLYQWALKSIKSFGANQDLLVLGTSESPDTGQSYFCVNTPQAEDILRVFRQATGVLPSTGNTSGLGRNSEGIDRVKRALERTTSRGVSRNENEDEEIHYEIFDEAENPNQPQVSPDNTPGISNVSNHTQVPVIGGETDILRNTTNQARMYYFPSSKRDRQSHIHSVPRMSEDIAKSQALKQRSNSPCFKDSVTRGYPDVKSTKAREEQDSNLGPSRRRPRSKNAFKILSSGRNTPQGLDEVSQCDPVSRASSRPTSPHNFIYRAISKLKVPFSRSRDNLANQELSPKSTRERRRGKERSEVPTNKHNKLDRPLPPRHIPTQPSQPIIVQHPQPIEQTAVQPQPSHFVPANQNHFSPPNQLHYNLTAQCDVAINRTETETIQTAPHNPLIQTNQVFSYPPPYLHNNPPQTSPWNQMDHQTAQWMHHNNRTNHIAAIVHLQQQQLRQQQQQQLIRADQLLSAMNTNVPPHHHVIHTTSPKPNTNTSIVSPPSGFKGTTQQNSQQQQQQQQQHVLTPLQHSSTAVSPQNLTNQFVANHPDVNRESGHYDHLSPENDVKSPVLQPLPDILQPVQKPVSASGMQSSGGRIPVGGQQTPLAFIQQQQQQQQQLNISKSSPERKLRRNEAFRSKPTPPPKPILSGNSSTAGGQPISSQTVPQSADYSHLSSVVPQDPVSPIQHYPSTDC